MLVPRYDMMRRLSVPLTAGMACAVACALVCTQAQRGTMYGEAVVYYVTAKHDCRHQNEQSRTSSSETLGWRPVVARAGAAPYNSFRRVTNPHMFDLGGVLLLGSSGQIVDDMAKYTRGQNR